LSEADPRFAAGEREPMAFGAESGVQGQFPLVNVQFIVSCASGLLYNVRCFRNVMMAEWHFSAVGLHMNTDLENLDTNSGLV